MGKSRACAQLKSVIKQKKAVLRVVVGARSCERWPCNMLDKDRCTRLSETGNIRN